MKKLIALTLTLISLLTLTTATAEKPETIEVFTVITGLDFIEDKVTCLDQEGELWEFYGIEDLFIGDELFLIMWTPTDEILDYKYVGYMSPQELAEYIRKACD